MSGAVFSMFTELRGPEGFEGWYQGEVVDSPIPLTPLADGLEERAAQMRSTLKAAAGQTPSYPISANGNGIDPFLVAGVPTPLGSTVLLWLPQLNINSESLQYNFRLIWRIRNFEQLLATRKPFHGRNNDDGPSDDGSNRFTPAIGGAAWSAAAGVRLPIVCAQETIIYAQTEPAQGVVAPQNAYSTRYVVDSDLDFEPPIFPGFSSGQLVNAMVSQGLGANPAYGSPTHSVIPVMAKGDELVVLLSRASTGVLDNTWDFTGADSLVSYYLGRGYPVGTEYIKMPLGVYVATGVSP